MVVVVGGGAVAVFVCHCVVSSLSVTCRDIFNYEMHLSRAQPQNNRRRGGGGLSFFVCVFVFSSFSKATAHHSPCPHHHCLRVVASCTVMVPPPRDDRSGAFLVFNIPIEQNPTMGYCENQKPNLEILHGPRNKVQSMQTKEERGGKEGCVWGGGT